MVFWTAILVGALFVWLAVRQGFYATWILLFNVLFSIYMAVFLTPVVTGFAPTSGRAASYGVALSMIVLAGGCFALLHGLSYVFLTGQFNIPFPRVFDIVLSGVSGFAAGFLVLSFAAIVLATTPLARYRIVGAIGFNRQAQQANIRCLATCCDLIHAVARVRADENTTQAAIDRLIDAGNSLDPGPEQLKSDTSEPPTPPGQSPAHQSFQRRKTEDLSTDMP